MYPGLTVNRPAFNLSEMDSAVDPGDNDLFGPEGDINFGVFADETGGKLFYNRNDVDGEMREAQRIGSEYYTLTYQPHGGEDNGRFRRIRVTMRDPSLRVATKIGYYAPDPKAPTDPLAQRIQSMMEAVQATVPFDALHLSLSDVLRHPDAQTAEVILQVAPKDLHWLPEDEGKSYATLLVASAVLNGRRDILRMRAVTERFTALTQDTSVIAHQLPLTIDLTIPTSKKMQSIRIAVETEHSGRVGVVEVNRARMEAAPSVPTQPHLAPPRQGPGAASTDKQ